MKSSNYIKKIFLILLFILFFSLIFISNKCFATMIFTCDNVQYEIPELPFDTAEHPDFVITKLTNGKGYQVGYPNSDYDLPFYRQGDGIKYYIKGTNTYGHWAYYNYTFNGNSELDSWSDKKVTNQYDIKIYSDGAHTADLIYSNTDIILKSDGSIFFQKTPLTGVGILAVEAVDQIPKVIKQEMKMIIPIGLVIFGILLLILLIKLVILRMT